MNNDRIEITDELMARYLEGNLTGEERSAVEAYLADNKEAMDDLFFARTELAYVNLVKHLVAEGIVLDEKIQRKRKARLYVTGGIVLAVVAAVVFWIWRISTPIQMRVNIIEDKAYSIPKMPFEKGVMQCEYADNALQTISLGAENTTVSLNDIPYKYRNLQVHVVFEAEGYQIIDTLVPVQKTLTLVIRRTNDLGMVFGRVVDFKSGNPIAEAKVRLLDMETATDGNGQFRIDIPFEKQDKAQRIEVIADGYPLWEGYFRPSTTDPWVIVLGDNQ